MNAATPSPTEGTIIKTAKDAAKRVDQRTRGVWLTHDQEISKVTPHSSEIAALRDAVETGKTATFVEFGKTIAEATK